MRRLVSLSIASLFWAGCAQGGAAHDASSLARAHVLALSTYSASVGTLVDVYGEHFPLAPQGQPALHFVGAFTSDSGAVTNVDRVLDAHAVDSSTLRWTSFGPYEVPFTTGPSTGRFIGTVGVTITTPEGSKIESIDKTPVAFDVEPSIVVHEFQPVTASCAGPVLRGIGGIPYRMRVEAVGFEPAAFTYTLSAPALSSDPVVVRHRATGQTDTIDERSNFVLAPVPDGDPFYTAVLTIEGSDAHGRVYTSAFALNVRRPLEIFYNGSVEVAQVYSPTPVSGCTPGGINGRQVTYQEAESETRTRDYNVHWDQNWLAMHTVTTGTSSTVGAMETNGIGFSTTDGQTFNWQFGMSGSIGSELIGSVALNYMVGGAHNTQQTNNQDRQQGVNTAETTTDTTQESSQTGGSSGSSASWNVSSMQYISNTFGGTIVAGTYGVFYRQTVRLLRKGVVVTYNQCGLATVVGDIDLDDWAWSPDLALGSACPPLPASNLPAAACFAPPCDGG